MACSTSVCACSAVTVANETGLVGKDIAENNFDGGLGCLKTNTSSAQTCAGWCAKTAGCPAYTWVPVWPSTLPCLPGACFLKNALRPMADANADLPGIVSSYVTGRPSTTLGLVLSPLSLVKLQWLHDFGFCLFSSCTHCGAPVPSLRHGMVVQISRKTGHAGCTLAQKRLHRVFRLHVCYRCCCCVQSSCQFGPVRPHHSWRQPLHSSQHLRRLRISLCAYSRLCSVHLPKEWQQLQQCLLPEGNCEWQARPGHSLGIYDRIEGPDNA